MNRIDLIGQRFGRLLVLSRNEEKSKQQCASYFLCRCDCGKEKVIYGNNLRIGSTKSCGCLSREIAKELCKRLSRIYNQTGENASGYLHGFCIEERNFRETVRHRDKVCQICGKTKEENGRELDVHHLDGNHYNNVLDNGVTLCKGCHAIITNNSNVWRP